MTGSGSCLNSADHIGLIHSVSGLCTGIPINIGTEVAVHTEEDIHNAADHSDLCMAHDNILIVSSLGDHDGAHLSDGGHGHQQSTALRAQVKTSRISLTKASLFSRASE